MLKRRAHAIAVVLAVVPAVLVAACKPGGCQSEREDVAAPVVPLADVGVRRIVLISIDTLRADHLGTYGHVRKTSPNLDALAAGGAVFEDTSSTAPWTLPAHSSMLTGLYPEQTGARTTRDVLGEDVPTIAEGLLAAGYRTAGIANVIWFRTVRGLHRGFESWELLPEDESAKGAAEVITDRGIGFLEQTDGERSFLFLHYFDAHSPYHSLPAFEHAFLPPEFRERSKVDGTTMQLGLVGKGYGEFSAQEREDVKKLYDAGILQLDDELGRLFRFIETRFGFDDTLVIVTSDHGEGFFEHGTYSHGQTQYQEQLHVPLILRGGPVPAGVRVRGPTSLIDIAPTIFAAATVSLKRSLPGVDLADYWQHPDRARDERVLFGQSAPGTGKDVIRMVRRGRFKLIINSETGQRELYDLGRDPTEHEDLSEARSKLVDDLSGLMEQFFSRRVEEPANTLELDPEVVERLQELGYVE